MSWAGCIGLNSKVSILIQSRVYARSPVPELKGDCEKRVDIAIKSRLVEQVELLGCPVWESREKCESQGAILESWYSVLR